MDQRVDTVDNVSTATAAATSTLASRARRSMLDGLHVLFIDDQEDVRRLVALILKRFGASVETVDSVANAQSSLQRRVPDVIVSDIQMPHATGIDLIRAVRQDTAVQLVPAAALSAFGREEDISLALGAGFQEYMKKPVEPVVLAETVARLAGRGADRPA